MALFTKCCVDVQELMSQTRRRSTREKMKTPTITKNVITSNANKLRLLIINVLPIRWYVRPASIQALEGQNSSQPSCHSEPVRLSDGAPYPDGQFPSYQSSFMSYSCQLTSFGMFCDTAGLPRLRRCSFSLATLSRSFSSEMRSLRRYQPSVGVPMLL